MFIVLPNITPPVLKKYSFIMRAKTFSIYFYIFLFLFHICFVAKCLYAAVVNQDDKDCAVVQHM